MEHVSAAVSIAFCSFFCFVCTCLQIASECNSKHERNVGVLIPLRAVIYHGILKLLIWNIFTIAGTVSAVKILHKLREWGTRLGVCLSCKLEYTYLAECCLISFSLPCLLICFYIVPSGGR